MMKYWGDRYADADLGCPGRLGFRNIGSSGSTLAKQIDRRPSTLGCVLCGTAGLMLFDACALWLWCFLSYVWLKVMALTSPWQPTSRILEGLIRTIIEE